MGPKMGPSSESFDMKMGLGRWRCWQFGVTSEEERMKRMVGLWSHVSSGSSEKISELPGALDVFTGGETEAWRICLNSHSSSVSRPEWHVSLPGSFWKKVCGIDRRSHSSQETSYLENVNDGINSHPRPPKTQPTNQPGLGP